MERASGVCGPSWEAGRGDDAVRLSNRDPQAAAALVRQACQSHQPIEVRRGTKIVILRDAQ